MDKIVAGFQALWKRLHISNDDFLRTSEPRHHRVVQEFFRRAKAKGDVYKGEYTGLYCTPCESYWTELQLDEDGCCPDCHRPVEKVSEEAYFFKLSNYADRLLKHIEENPDFIRPTSRRNEMISFIKQGLDDLCISRTSFDWGIPVPDDEKHVIYVWFDALTNYVTAAGFFDDPEKFKKFWPADVHLVGKEIVRFHSIIWPAILMSLDLPLPKQIYGHGWLIVDGDKMSKSKGNVVDPNLLIDEFGADAIRYFLLREIALGQDGNFSRDALIGRINADLANDLGNLLHRTLNMIGKFQDGVIEAATTKSATDEALIADAAELVAAYEAGMENMEISPVMKKLWAFIGRANKYIDETAPWALAKDPAKKPELSTVMYNLAESLRVISLLISPFMPETAPKIWAQLGMKGDIWAVRLDDVKTWGGVSAGQHIGQAEPIFPRIEVEKEEKGASGAKQEKQKAAPKQEKKAETADGVVTIDEFKKIELRVAEVTAAERVPKTDKLMKLTLTLGDETREVVSGIADVYTAEELVGKHVVLVANLKPAKLRGIMSHGMVLAASDGEKLRLIETELPAGSVVR